MVMISFNNSAVTPCWSDLDPLGFRIAYLKDQGQQLLLLPLPQPELKQNIQILKEPRILALRTLVIVRVRQVGHGRLVFLVRPSRSKDPLELGSSENRSVR